MRDDEEFDDEFDFPPDDDDDDLTADEEREALKKLGDANIVGPDNHAGDM
jgi:hypothetical protein